MFHCSGAQVRYTSITESTVSSAQNMPAPSKESVGVCGTVFVIGSLLAGCSTRSLRQKKTMLMSVEQRCLTCFPLLLTTRHDAHSPAADSEVCGPGIHPRLHHALPENPGLAPRLRLHAVKRFNGGGDDTRQVWATQPGSVYLLLLSSKFPLLNIHAYFHDFPLFKANFKTCLSPS